MRQVPGMIAGPPSKTTIAQKRCGGQTAYRLCPLSADVTLSSPSRHLTRHPQPRLRIIRRVHHVTAKSASIPPLYDKILTSPNQSAPKPTKTKFFVKLAWKGRFRPFVSVCSTWRIHAIFNRNTCFTAQSATQLNSSLQTSLQARPTTCILHRAPIKVGI